MNVKLMQGISGDGCGRAGFFMPRQIIKCSDSQGARFIAEGIAEEAPNNAALDGEFFDQVPEPEAPARKKAPERAVKGTPEAPETRGAPDHCQAKTGRGNACLKAPLRGSRFCAKHADID
jgi:hypothetical protein